MSENTDTTEKDKTKQKSKLEQAHGIAEMVLPIIGGLVSVAGLIIAAATKKDK